MDRSPTSLVGIGFWDDGEIPGLPSPQALGTMVYPRKGRLLSYLMAGKVAAEYLGYSYCRFQCGIVEEEMGFRTLTDGHWAWPEGLAHNIECHDVKLPDEFLQHVASNKYQIPSGISDESMQELNYTYDYWIAWSKANLTASR